MLRIVYLTVAAVAYCLAPLPALAGPALLYDAGTGRVLFAEAPDHPWFPASLAKMMTAYVVFETWKAGKVAPTDKLTISVRANSRPRMRLGLGAGKVITFDEAMAALILYSANDIAVALAEAVAGSEAQFVVEMNATAARLGMASTRFVNANGLPGEGQYATARDLATLTQAILRNFPEHAGLFAAKTAPVGARTVATHNPVLIRVPGGNGMKTGFTCSAGYNIVGSVTREGHTLVAIVLGEPTPAKREARTKALLEQGFRMLASNETLPSMTLDTMPVEPFEAEQVWTANLAKRFKDCQPRPPELDADGNPVCATAKEVGRGKQGRSAKVQKQEQDKSTKCAPPIIAKIKPVVQQKKIAAKRPVAKAARIN